MKKYLKFIEETDLNYMLTHVNDHYEYLQNDKHNKLLNDKLRIKSLIEKLINKNLNEFFKEKLIFKLFNECNWSISKIVKETECSSINQAVEILAENYNIKI